MAVLSVDWRDIERSCGFVFEDDKGELPASKCLLLELPSKRDVSLYAWGWELKPGLLQVLAPAAELDPFGLLDELVTELRLPVTAVKWESEQLKSAQRWQLKRQDDQGTIYTVSNFWLESQARFYCEHSPSKYPGQRCWVEVVPPAPDQNSRKRTNG